VTNKTAATRYARALLDVAVKEQQDLTAIEHQLAEFAGLFTQYPALERVLVNPAVPAPRKRLVVEQLTARGKFVANVAKLLAMLAERDRLILVPDLLAAYRDRLQDHLNVVRAQITTAVPMAESRAKAVEQSLATATGRGVTLDARVDPSILGGIVARVGGTVYDASVSRQLQRMKERLVEGN